MIQTAHPNIKVSEEDADKFGTLTWEMEAKKMRKFRLLKDINTPTWNIPAGSIFEEGGSIINMYTYGKIAYESERVENNPEWFAEVKEEEKRWTDEDMIMFLWQYSEKWNDESTGLTTLQCLDDFKKRGL